MVGKGDGENFIASDIPAFLEHTRQMLMVDDDRVVEITEGNIGDHHRPRWATELPLDERPSSGTWKQPKREASPTFMEKEIHEQPKAIADTIRGRIRRDGLVRSRVNWGSIPSGFESSTRSSCRLWHFVSRRDDGQVRHRALDRLPVEIDIASEFRYRDPVLDVNSLVIGNFAVRRNPRHPGGRPLCQGAGCDF